MLLQIVNIFKVSYYPKYSMNNFTNILSVLAKGKIVNKGYPREGMSLQEKAEYCYQLSKETNLGTIQPNEIVFRSAMSKTCKDLMNSMIGKDS